MPFQSEKQRRYLWANHPDIAKRWAHEYPNQKSLPMYKHKKDDKSNEKEPKQQDKAAALGSLYKGLLSFTDFQSKYSVPKEMQENMKRADSHLATVSILNDEKPTYAGEVQEKLTPKPEEKVLSAEEGKHKETPENTAQEIRNKIAVVLSQHVRRFMDNHKGYTPYNVGLSNKLQPSPAQQIPLPVGYQKPQQPQQPQQQQGQNPAAYQGALGGPGAISPSANPINNYGPLSASGDINGNAAFGMKNSPDSNKSASAKPCSCGCGDTTETCTCGPDCSCRKPGGSCYKADKTASSPAWQRSEGKNDAGGLNAKGRASYNKATGGHLKAPVTESNPSGDRAKRQNSFCSRMCGMKKHETGSATKKDPDSRINKALSKWNCKCGSSHEIRGLFNLPSVSDGKDKKNVSPGLFPKDKDPGEKLNPAATGEHTGCTSDCNKAAHWLEKAAKKYVWGGQRWQAGEGGINPQVGYSYLGGMIPTPDVALRVGTPGFGLFAGLHPLPYGGIDFGQPSGRHGSHHGQRSLWKYMADDFRTPEDSFFLELSRIDDKAPPERYEQLLRDRGLGRSSEEIGALAKILSESADVKRNAMARRLPAAVNKVMPGYDAANPSSVFQGFQAPAHAAPPTENAPKPPAPAEKIGLYIYQKAAARGERMIREQKDFNMRQHIRDIDEPDAYRGYQTVRKPEDYQTGGRFSRATSKSDAQHKNRVLGEAGTLKQLRDDKKKSASAVLDIFAKAAARGDATQKLLSRLNNDVLFREAELTPPGKATTGGWQTTYGVVGAPNRVNHHFDPRSVREIDTPPVKGRDLIKRVKDTLPLGDRMPVRGGDMADDPKRVADAIRQLRSGYQKYKKASVAR